MRTLLKRSRLLVASTLALFIACSASEAPRRGQLMVALATDMSVPKDVSHIRIKIKVGAEVRWEYDYLIAPDGEFHLPGTLAVVEGSTPNPAVSVEVIGIRSRGDTKEARTFRKSVTTIPKERTVLLRVPVQWLCDETALSDGDGDYLSTCEPIDGEESACVAGTCEPVAVDVQELPTYEPQLVYGGGSDPSDPLAQCFDTVGCLDKGEDVPAGELGEDCTLTLDDDGKPLNVGLRMNDDNGDGICHGNRGDESPCYIPLDKDDRWGWRLEGDAPNGKRKVRLPPGVCKKLDEGRFAAVRVSTACETKTGAYHTCGPWSAIAGGDPNSGAGGSTGEGGGANVGGNATGEGGGTTTGGGSAGMSGEGGDATGGPVAGSGGDSSGAGGAGADGGIVLDPNLDAKVRADLGLGTEPITEEVAASVTVLQAPGLGITDLSGLEHFVGLDTLLLNNNDITDISPLASLVQLSNLNLNDNPQLDDIAALEFMTGLDDVDLVNLPLTDLAPLVANSGLVDFDSVSVYGLGPLVGCTEIAALQARNVTVFYDNGCP